MRVLTGLICLSVILLLGWLYNRIPLPCPCFVLHFLRFGLLDHGGLHHGPFTLHKTLHCIISCLQCLIWTRPNSTNAFYTRLAIVVQGTLLHIQCTVHETNAQDYITFSGVHNKHCLRPNDMNYIKLWWWKKRYWI